MRYLKAVSVSGAAVGLLPGGYMSDYPHWQSSINPDTGHYCIGIFTVVPHRSTSERSPNNHYRSAKVISGWSIRVVKQGLVREPCA